MLCFFPFFILSPNFALVYLKKATAPGTAGFPSDSFVQTGKVLSTQVFKTKCSGSINFHPQNTLAVCLSSENA